MARLAGLPDEVIARAKEILVQLEASDINHRAILESAQEEEPDQQLTLFGSAGSDDIIQDLQGLDINALTPMEALNTLYDLHMRAKLR